MQIVSLYDEVEIELNMKSEISVKVLNAELNVPMEKNLAYIAAQKFYENYPPYSHGGAYITITKNIPIAAGLGGGSADAAAVLRGLNKIYDSPFTIKELCDIGMQIGSDVPFCIVGGAQVCNKRGNVVISTFGIQHYRILIAIGDEKESTADQYRKLDQKYNDFKDYKMSMGFTNSYVAFNSGRCREGFTHMANIFETIYDENSSIHKIKKIMYDNGAKAALLSGSGPSVFGVFIDMFYMEDAQAVLEKEGYRCYPCQPINIAYKDMSPYKDPWTYN
jgi:4-diphosphocytidyl-2-C-methyl-D-erythritol kinase